MEALSGHRGNPSCRGGWGWLYSGPTSGGVRSDRLVPFGAARLEPIGSFGSVLSVHLCSAEVLYRDTVYICLDLGST
jgi:hypothetical protein